ncbi:MAG: hypothetical protein EB832_00225, partial [Thaumarchaeota archaeon S14]
ALGNLGRSAEAMEALDSALSLDPGSDELRVQKLRAMRLLGRDSAAREGDDRPPYPARDGPFEN